MTERSEFCMQTKRLNVFTVKRKEDQIIQSYNSYPNEEKIKYSKIENFIITSIGDQGNYKNGHYVQNLYIRSPFSLKNLFEVNSSELILNFPTYFKELAKKTRNNLWFKKMIFILRNIVSNKTR